MRATKHIHIIGSGFGGLALGIRLQAAGFQVTIFEKNATVGGHATQLKSKGYTFDLGPSLITAPDIIEKVFTSAGKQMSDYLDLIYLDPFYRIFFGDGSSIDYTADADEMKTQMAAFNVADAQNYDKFMAYVKQLYQAVITDGLGSTPFDMSAMLRFLPKALKLRALLPAYRMVSKFFKDERNRFIFSFHPLFIGGNPFRAPSVYLMIPYLEKAGGVWFTKGGMYSVVLAFKRLFEELGGVIHTNSEVQEVVVENGKAKGVIVHNTFFPADAVVSNAHFAHTHLDLLKPQYRRKWNDRKVKKMDYSMSSFLLYIGVKKQYPKLLHHTLILSHRYRELVEDIFKRKILPDDFSMYLHVPSRSDAEMAPPGCESMYVLIPVANNLSGINWKEKSPEFTKTVLDYLEHEFGLTDLQENIEVLEAFTPDDFRVQRNNYLGSAWGLEPSLLQSAMFRPSNRSEDIENFYLVGASTHPGAGVPGVLLTAETTEKVIFDDFSVIKNMVTQNYHQTKETVKK